MHAFRPSFANAAFRPFSYIGHTEGMPVSAVALLLFSFNMTTVKETFLNTRRVDICAPKFGLPLFCSQFVVPHDTRCGLYFVHHFCEHNTTTALHRRQHNLIPANLKHFVVAAFNTESLAFD